MIAMTQRGLNVALAVAIPAAGLAYVTFGTSMSVGRSAQALVALGLLWLSGNVALNIFRRPQPVVVGRSLPATVGFRQGIPSYVVNVSQPGTPWRWTSGLLAPLELLVVVWSVPVIILAILVPVGLAITSLLWLGRAILRL